MFIKIRSLLIPVTTIIFLFFSDAPQARNCVKGKPCGSGCISREKSCRIDSSTDDTAVKDQPHTVIRRSFLQLPEVFTVIAKSVYAVEAPHSNIRTGHYKKDQNVFVYKTEKGWARISNMQPEEWVKLDKLKPK